MSKHFKIDPNKKFALLLGPLLFALVILLVPDSLFAFKSRVAIATIFWMGCWWISMPVAVGVTALLPILINAIFGLVPMTSIISQYASEIVILLLGADLITLAWEETGLDRRCAVKALCIIGPSLKQQIVVWFTMSAVLSIFLANAVVCAIMVPIAFSMLKFAGEGDMAQSKAGPIILASIAWGAGIGGLGSPLGGSMNLVAVDYFEQLTGHEFMYVNWIVRLLPVLVVLILMNVIILLFIRPKGVSLNGSKQYFHQLYQQLPPMSRDEKVSGILFVVAAVAAFARPLYAQLLPELKPAYLFLAVGFLTFLLPKKRGGRLLTWDKAEKGVVWGLLYLFAGGLALGILISDTGAAQSIAALVNHLPLSGGLGTIFLFTAFTVLLAEISSNTAAASISLPVIISIAQGIGLNPIPYIYLCAAAFNCGYVLPTSIRSIPVGYGVSAKYLFKNGMLLTISSIIVITLLGFGMLLLFASFLSVA